MSTEMWVRTRQQVGIETLLARVPEGICLEVEGGWVLPVGWLCHDAARVIADLRVKLELVGKERDALAEERDRRADDPRRGLA